MMKTKRTQNKNEYTEGKETQDRHLNTVSSGKCFSALGWVFADIYRLQLASDFT